MATNNPRTPTAKAPKRASLLSLPTELRLHIYDLVFTPTPAEFASQAEQDELVAASICANSQPSFPGLPTCAAVFCHPTNPLPSLMRASSFLRREAAAQYCEYVAPLQRALEEHIVYLGQQDASAKATEWHWRWSRVGCFASEISKEEWLDLLATEMEDTMKTAGRVEAVLRSL